MMNAMMGELAKLRNEFAKAKTDIATKFDRMEERLNEMPDDSTSIDAASGKEPSDGRDIENLRAQLAAQQATVKAQGQQIDILKLRMSDAATAIGAPVAPGHTPPSWQRAQRVRQQEEWQEQQERGHVAPARPTPAKAPQTNAVSSWFTSSAKEQPGLDEGWMKTMEDKLAFLEAEYSLGLEGLHDKIDREAGLATEEVSRLGSHIETLGNNLQGRMKTMEKVIMALRNDSPTTRVFDTKKSAETSSTFLPVGSSGLSISSGHSHAGSQDWNASGRKAPGEAFRRAGNDPPPQLQKPSLLVDSGQRYTA